MIKIFLALFIFLLSSYPLCAATNGLSRNDLYISVIQDPPVLANRSAMLALIAYSKQANIRRLFVQVYRADQAWFPSKVGDQAPYLAALKAVGEDPFALLISLARKEGIQVHAWVNLLSLSKNTDAPLLKKYGPSILTRNNEKKESLTDYKIDNQYFLEPGDLRVQAELLYMVGELLRAYPSLDGIHFDYIRYPDKDPRYGYTKMNTDRFKVATGVSEITDSSKVWQNWKREQVTTLLRRLVKRSRMLRPGIQVSTTGCSSYHRAFDEAFQDWPSWVNSGLVDFVTVMTYASDPVNFEASIADALVRVTLPEKLNITVGAYQKETTPEILSQQWQACLVKSKGSCVLFHYGNLVTSPGFKEMLPK